MIRTINGYKIYTPRNIYTIHLELVTKYGFNETSLRDGYRYVVMHASSYEELINDLSYIEADEEYPGDLTKGWLKEEVLKGISHQLNMFQVLASLFYYLDRISEAAASIAMSKTANILWIRLSDSLILAREASYNIPTLREYMSVTTGPKVSNSNLPESFIGSIPTTFEVEISDEEELED